MLAMTQQGSPTTSARGICTACGAVNGGTLQHLVSCPEQLSLHREFDVAMTRRGIVPSRDPWERAWLVFNSNEELLEERIQYANKLVKYIRSLQKHWKIGELYLANPAVHSQRPARSSPTRVSQLGATIQYN